MGFEENEIEDKVSILAEPAVRYERATSGLSKSDFLAYVADTGMNLTEYTALLPVTRRTIEKAKDNDLLSPQVSDRVLQIAELYEFGSEVLGGKDEFNRWLKTPLIAIAGKRPMDYMDKETGMSLVRDLLGRIAFGVYS